MKGFCQLRLYYGTYAVNTNFRNSPNANAMGKSKEACPYFSKT